ncbi:MAG: hypothetical protein KatS3mg043_1891 [Rhodothermaceae bacterium]|nr:MAG: hypothetical protein KatS3mg043_1891 [Rhodothermaceae bacterium]
METRQDPLAAYLALEAESDTIAEVIFIEGIAALSERPTVAADLDALRVPSVRAFLWARGRTREGCGYIALHTDAFNSMDQRYKHEFWHGEIVAMAGAGLHHNRITASTARALGNRPGSRERVQDGKRRKPARFKGRVWTRSASNRPNVGGMRL